MPTDHEYIVITIPFRLTYFISLKLRVYTYIHFAHITLDDEVMSPRAQSPKPAPQQKKAQTPSK